MAKRSRILIVDDEPFNVDYLEQELELLGYETESAASGREAFEKVAATAPDLILLDVMMPGIDGFTVCRMLKDDRKTRRIPIVIMTSLNATEDRIKGIEAGADDFLSKPVNEQELIARIKAALRFKHAVDDEIDELRRVSDHLAKFVPDAVKRLIEANPASPELQKREQDVSILFVDISGYSRLSEMIAPEVLNMLVERYFSTFLDRIHDYDGEVSETSGDGLMAIFPGGDPDKHAVKAIDTALALLDANEALNAENTVQPLAIHIGVNSGPALMGPTRYQGRRGVRWIFTADGPVINLAARLAGIAKEGEIIAGAETIRRLADRYPLRQLGRERLKNIADPIEIIRVLGPPSAKHEPRRILAIKEESQSGVSRRLGTVLATDAFHEASAERGGDESTRAPLGTCQEIIDRRLTEHRGRVLERVDDNLIAEFGSPLAAVQCAVAIQQALRKHGHETSSDRWINARIGIGLGYIVIEEGRVAGDGVNVATGLKELARPGDICVAETVHENVRQEMDAVFEDCGEQQVAEISRPVRMYRLRNPGLTSTAKGSV